MADYFGGVLVLIIFALGMWVWKLRNDKFEKDREAAIVEKERDEFAEMGKGLAEYQQKLLEKKNRAKEKIMELLKEKGKISNRQVAESLKISSASIRRYFDELEVENKVKQVGQDGKDVFYKAS